MSSLPTDAYNLKIAATASTPTVTFGTLTETYKMSAAPAGYMKINVGGSARYIPFWS